MGYYVCVGDKIVNSCVNSKPYDTHTICFSYKLQLTSPPTKWVCRTRKKQIINPDKVIDCTYSTGIQNEGCNIGNRCDYIYEKDDNIGIDLDKD